MMMKKIGIMTACFAVFGSLMCVSASALEDGVYTGTMVTSYYNPDTGNVDDGGTANAALGEGMCRSATDEACLVEVDGDDVWVTVRLLLQSNCSNVALYTRSDYDTYTQANYTVTSEDAANDSIDYRIKVSEPGQKLKATMYVSPMGRDVLWYLYVDTNSLQSGSGDFVVNIDTSKQETTAPAATTSSGQQASSSSGQQSATQQPAAPAASNTTTANKAPTSTNAGATSKTQQQNTEKGSENGSEETELNAEDAEKDENAQEQTDAETQEDRIAAAEQRAAERRAEREANAANTSAELDTEEHGTVNVALIVIVVVAVLAVAGGVTYYVLWKSKKGKGNKV